MLLMIHCRASHTAFSFLFKKTPYPDCYHVTVTFTLTMKITTLIDVGKICVNPYQMICIFLHHLIQLSFNIHV